MIVLTVTCIVILAVCWLLFARLTYAPDGAAKVRATATITIDGRQFVGSALWLTRAETKLGWGLMGDWFTTEVFGDAIVFRISETETLFMSPNDVAMRCAMRQHPDIKYYAEALSQLSGVCQPELTGRFTVAMEGQGEVPELQNFALGQDFRNDGGGREIPAGVIGLRDRGLKLRALELVPTSEPMESDMIERFPWILSLPRLDYCGREYPDKCNWAFGNTYAQYFTTSLPSPDL